MQDRHGHRISYLRVSITDRCNERCTYCMPQELQEWLPREEILSFEETLRIIRVAAELGVAKVRVTGGEPLTRRDVVHFIAQIPKVSGIKSLGLSTNGTLLARQDRSGKTMATALREAAVQSVNVSFDTLDRDVYSQITGREFHAQVLVGIEAEFQTNGPATYYQIPGRTQRIGFIGAMTNLHFCENCNKLRLTCDGKLRPCLGSYLEFDIMKPLRAGASDEELRQFFLDVVERKPAQHDFRDNYQPNRKMIAIGG